MIRFNDYLIFKKLTEKVSVEEDGAPANRSGGGGAGGAIAGVSPGQEPPMPKNSTSAAKRKKLQRRKQERIKKDIQTLNVVAPFAIKRKVK